MTHPVSQNELLILFFWLATLRIDEIVRFGLENIANPE